MCALSLRKDPPEDAIPTVGESYDRRHSNRQYQSSYVLQGKHERQRVLLLREDQGRVRLQQVFLQFAVNLLGDHNHRDYKSARQLLRREQQAESCYAVIHIGVISELLATILRKVYLVRRYGSKHPKKFDVHL